PTWGMTPIMALHFDQPDIAADTVLRALDRAPDAVLAVDDSGVELAAQLAARFGLPANPLDAVRTLGDKLVFRRLLREQGFACPAFHALPSGENPHRLLPTLGFPVVVKARRLSASRGVIRADDGEAFLRAVRRVRAIQARADRDAESLGLVVESFIPGREYALEGTLKAGVLGVLALFDKPDPLDGPYFEETIYVAPSRLPDTMQEHIRDTVARACHAAGLSDGPVHAEVRVNDTGVWLLEVAPRSIGGLCGRVMIHFLGIPLEELILRQALGDPLPIAGQGGAAGVMMIPIPRRGIYHGVEGLDAAQAVPGITGVTITTGPGQLIAPPPEGASYLGFIFSRAARAQDAEMALRIAHQRMLFDIRTEYPATVTAGAPS
ncbi:MAG: ATP-grasp domain-containing protein, partial [Proteobacteria bacterium]|nr:ATP-grasp domain-containing protein [Pseudomonadota bacterium]